LEYIPGKSEKKQKLNPLGCMYKIKLNRILVLKYLHKRSKIENIADIYIYIYIYINTHINIYIV
jgi:hypothetical protein